MNRADDTPEVLRERVREKLRQGDFPGAVREAERARQWATACNDVRRQAEALYLIGLSYRQQGDYSRAGEALEECLSLYEHLGETRGIVDARIIFSSVLTFDSGHIAALDCLRIALDLSHHDEYLVGEANALNCMAIIYLELGDHEGSLEALLRCLPLYERAGDRTNAARALNNIANCYLALDNPTEAIPVTERAISILHEVGDAVSLTRGYEALGQAYLQLGQTDAALEPLRRALTIIEPLGNRIIIATILSTLGKAYLTAGRLDEAVVVLESALKHNGSEGNRLQYCETLGHLGQLYARSAFSRHDDKIALLMLNEARRVAEEIGALDEVRPIYAALADLHAALSERSGGNVTDLKEALAYQRLLRDTEKHLFNNVSDRRLRGMQVRFSLAQARKDAEIAHLRTVELANALIEMERLRSLAEENARTDALTGVFNRRELERRLTSAFEHACRNGQPLALALLDVDHFKSINDVFGHAMGDLVLINLASQLRASCRESTGDLVARYGGEEFALLLPETGLEEALGLCERLRILVATDAVVAGTQSRVTVSVGLTAISGGEEATTETVVQGVAAMMAMADANLYAAKRNGRNRVCVVPG